MNFPHFSSDDKVIFEQWWSTDRSDLKHIETETQDFFKFLTIMIDKLTIHYYIAKCQSRYLKHLKNHLIETQWIVGG